MRVCGGVISIRYGVMKMFTCPECATNLDIAFKVKVDGYQAISLAEIQFQGEYTKFDAKVEWSLLHDSVVVWVDLMNGYEKF